MTMRVLRRSAFGVVFAMAALVGLLLSPFCDAYLPHTPDESTSLSTPTLYAETVSSPALLGVDAPRSGEDEFCCSVVAERPKAVSAEFYLFAGTSLDVVHAGGSCTRRGVYTPLHHWHRRAPGAPPVSALHARSAPLLI